MENPEPQSPYKAEYFEIINMMSREWLNSAMTVYLGDPTTYEAVLTTIRDAIMKLEAVPKAVKGGQPCPEGTYPCGTNMCCIITDPEQLKLAGEG